MGGFGFGRVGKHGLAVVALAAVMGLMGAAGAVAQASSSLPATPAPSVAIGSPTVVVNGSGSASAPANGAIVQLLARQLGVADATSPGADTSQTAVVTGAPAAPTKAQIKAIVDALVKAGVAKDGVMTSITPNGPVYGAFGQGIGVIAFQLNADQVAKTSKFIQTALKTGAEVGVAFDSVNSIYTTADCSSVANAALKAAIADAHAQAEAIAPALARSLGALVQAVSQSSYGKSYAGGGGGSNYCSQHWTLESALTSYLSSFDPNSKPEVEIYANVSLTYALI